MTIRAFVTAGVLLALASPASAQGSGRTGDFERQIETHALAIADAVSGMLDDALQRGARDERRGPEVTEPFSRTVRLGRNGAFDLSNVAGDIIITGGGGDDVRIDAVKRTRDRDEAAGRARLQDVDIQVRELPNRVEVRTEYPRGGRRDTFVVVDYTVAVPQNASVTLKTVSGDVRATNIRGDLNAESVSGSVTTSGARRLMMLKSVSGDIQITDAEAESPVTLTTVSGNLVARSLKARGIRLNTVSGDVRLDGVETDRVELRTVSGTIEYTGALARNGVYDMNTHSGDILLTVSTTGFDLEASTFSGDLRSDYAVTLGGTPVNVDERGRGRGRVRGPGRGIRGSFGDAGARLMLRSFSGEIVITRR